MGQETTGESEQKRDWSPPLPSLLEEQRLLVSLLALPGRSTGTPGPPGSHFAPEHGTPGASTRSRLCLPAQHQWAGAWEAGLDLAQAADTSGAGAEPLSGAALTRGCPAGPRASVTADSKSRAHTMNSRSKLIPARPGSACNAPATGAQAHRKKARLRPGLSQGQSERRGQYSPQTQALGPSSPRDRVPPAKGSRVHPGKTEPRCKEAAVALGYHPLDTASPWPGAGGGGGAAEGWRALSADLCCQLQLDDVAAALVDGLRVRCKGGPQGLRERGEALQEGQQVLVHVRQLLPLGRQRGHHHLQVLGLRPQTTPPRSLEQLHPPGLRNRRGGLGVGGGRQGGPRVEGGRARVQVRGRRRLARSNGETLAEGKAPRALTSWSSAPTHSANVPSASYKMRMFRLCRKQKQPQHQARGHTS